MMSVQELFRKRRQDLLDLAQRKGIDTKNLTDNITQDDDPLNVAALATFLGYDVRFAFDSTLDVNNFDQQFENLRQQREELARERLARDRLTRRF
jgi:hypothetical protein